MADTTQLAKVHVLHHGRVLCAAEELRGIPSEWPPGHRWMSIEDFTSEDERENLCDGCERTLVTLRRTMAMPLKRYDHTQELSWRVWCPSYKQTEADAHLITASSAKVAAEFWASAHDSMVGMPVIALGAKFVVCVRANDDEAPMKRYMVSDATKVKYLAEEIS